MIIFVIKDGTARKIKLDIDPRSTVFDLKTIVCREMYIKVSEQRLFFNDSELENDKTLESYNIKTLTTLRVKRQSSDEGKSGVVNQQVARHEGQAARHALPQAAPLERENSVVNQQVARHEGQDTGLERENNIVTGYEQNFDEEEQQVIISTQPIQMLENQLGLLSEAFLSFERIIRNRELALQHDVSNEK
ncbi:ubiquitin family domain-containing protein [Ditylenchus destructor]|uniref:Ubiquitin family domain-containing protein n=1 Tax=Ditylenchus destructor TaxID=166010 RepID=A0AAD4QZ37_9BILA|nr:ubiquitin family domain-containing protein [Ditylenchus destructor]